MDHSEISHSRLGDCLAQRYCQAALPMAAADDDEPIMGAGRHDCAVRLAWRENLDRICQHPGGVTHSRSMRVGVLARGEVEQLEWAHRLGFRSIEWMAFDASPAVKDHSAWESFARRIGDAAGERDVRISAIGAYYRNPLDPRQSDHARAIFERAIEIAALLGVRTVSGFAGAVIETEVDERGGNPVYRPFENYLPRLLQFWEPLADRAADKGVRIAFEHCPQGPYHLPVMHSNMLAQPAMWERFFDATRCGNLGLEWDPSHLLCQFIDPVDNVHKFGSRIFHVHAKDAFINQGLLRTYGICHPGVAEHRFPGLGQANWAQIVHTLLRVGYDSDLNIEGWHDPVYRDRDPHSSDAGSSGRDRARLNLEGTGLMLARRTLEPYVAGTE